MPLDLRCFPPNWALAWIQMLYTGPGVVESEQKTLVQLHKTGVFMKAEDGFPSESE